LPHSLLLALSLGAVATARVWGSEQKTIDDEKVPVPGKNPLKFCSSPDDDLITIDHVNLDPNPPKPGTVLSIEAKGSFTEDIEEGAYVLLTVKYGLITLIKQQEDLCSQMENVDKECPLEKGDVTITKEVELPSAIPPGKYTVLADVFTFDDRRITCLEATVAFSR